LIAVTLAVAAVLPFQTQSQEIAAERFPQVGCPVSVDLADVSSRELALADPDNCAIHFNPEARKEPVYVICQTMVHEYGHLAGLGHSSDPANVMYPVQTPEAAPLPCLDLDPAVDDYFFSAPAHRRIRVSFKVRRKAGLFDLLRAFVSGRRAAEVGSVSGFERQGVRLSVGRRGGRVTILVHNRSSRRHRVEVYIGPAD
jgi:hypothetical protein